LIEESLIVALVCIVFLFHLRSALVAIVMLPIGVLIAFLAMHALGMNSNIMSLGGIAIAIGAMIDAAIVMIENAHKHTVFGKAGRALTATDPAPLEMFETVINLKPESAWRPGLTQDQLIADMDAALRFPGVANSWTMPIKARIDMLSTGIRTPIGIKVFGNDLQQIESVARDIERVVRAVPGTTSAYAERLTGGFYLDIEPDLMQLARPV